MTFYSLFAHALTHPTGYISSYPHANKLGTESRGPHGRYISKYTSMVENIFWKGHELEIGGVRISGKLWASSREERVACRNKAFDLAAAGAITPLVDRSRKFVGVDSAADAVDYMLSGKSIGKVVVDINPAVLDVCSHGEMERHIVQPEYNI